MSDEERGPLARTKLWVLGFLAMLGLAAIILIVRVANNLPPGFAARSASLDPPSGTAAQAWTEVDRLISEQKLQEALKKTDAILAEAKKAKDEAQWTRALVKSAQLQVSLHGYETAVRFLMEQPWPEDQLDRDILNLFYAQSLETYFRGYSWEINQREKVASAQKVDLKAWTRDEIYAEACRAYEEVLKDKEFLGLVQVSAVKEYLVPNNYPPGIRPTFRDAVTYLYADLLGDSQFWTPAQSNELYRIGVAPLLSEVVPSEGAEKAGLDLAHPLVRRCELLAGLESWHRGRGEAEATLEARLERLRRLHSAYTEEEDRLLIVQDLEKRLADLGRFEWWSWGMGDLASFVRQESAEDSQVRARQIAAKGFEAHQSSPGGQRCLSILKSIEAPEFSLQSMQTDAPAKRSIQVNHRNLGALYFRAYRLDLLKIVETEKDYYLLPNWSELRDIIERRKPDAEWTQDLPLTPDYRTHRSFSTTPDLPPGAYAVAASAKKDFSKDHNAVQAINMVVSHFVLLRTTGPSGESVVTVLRAESGKPAQGVKVHLYLYDYQKGHQKADTLVTGDDGTVRFAPGKAPPGRQTFVLAQKGDDFALDSAYFYPDNVQPEGDVSACLIYTDRSVYRPLQKVLWKVVAYGGSRQAGQLKTVPSCGVNVILYDHNRQKVEEKAVTANAFGTASGEFTIPAGRLLGNWSIETSPQGRANFRVEEYKRPTFEATFKDPSQPLRLNRPASLTAEAKYYFGLPVSSGQVKWKVTREPVYPWWWGWFWDAPRSRSQIVASGASDLKEDGTFTVTFTPAADEREAAGSKDVSYRFLVSADVTDEGGETRTASRSVRLGFVAVEATLATKTGFFREGIPPAVSITRTDLDGTPRPGKGSWRLVALKQAERTLLPSERPLPQKQDAPGRKAPFRTPGDLQRPRWDESYTPEESLASWADGGEIAKGDLQHDEKGLATAEFGPLPGGAYRIRYETTDDFGAKYDNFKDFVVAAEKTPLNLPLVLFAESTSVASGDTLRLFVHSGLADQEMHLEFYRDGRLEESRTLTPGSGSAIVEMPVKESDRGGFGVRLWALRDDQFLRAEKQIYVPWDNKKLKVQFATFRDKLRPGAKETWRVTVKGPAGAALGEGAAEILAYMYDRSLDLFGPHYPPSVASLYPWKVRTANLRANLGAAWPQFTEDYGLAGIVPYPTFEEDRLQFYEDYGIGGPGVAGGVLGGIEGGQIAMPQQLRMANARDEDSSVMLDGFAAKSKVAGGKGGDDRRADAPATTVSEAPPPPAPEAPQLRSNFAETAFWLPHLLTQKDGSAVIEFTAPDSVTAWNVWVHALTRDLQGGSLKEEARSVKDLMVRPYVPRFFREGDTADLKVVVNNAGERELKGSVKLEIFDPETNENLLPSFGLRAADASRPFTVKAGGGTNISFPLAAPKKVGLAAFKVTATTGDLSDGELRPVPLLPSRVHLAQSRFAALHDADRRDLVFEEMPKADDPTRMDEMLVVTVDAQLFYSVLSALPYLVNYPYECTEQTMNRYLSTGILASLFKDYPAVGRMAQEFAKRDTVLETWDAVDPNRKIALEETPWVVEAKGGTDEGFGMAKVLDPRVAVAERDASLAKLRKAQTALGGFPWWPGGPPSPWMTLYILYGFSKGMEFGVEPPKDVTVKAWAYMHKHFIDEVVREMMGLDCCWEFVTFLNYVLSNYPDKSWSGGVFTDAERKQMLDFSFRHWKEHSPYSKCQLALTLKRMGRAGEAKLVFDSVMDSSKTTRDEGTFWAPEDRSWLWYNDRIETHAFALRALMELSPKDERSAGLVQWLFLNKKLNHWKSTKATAEVVYSLAHYLKGAGALGIREDATVIVGSQRTDFVFEPDKYTGKKNQIIVPGEKVDPKTMSDVVVQKEGKGLAFASATWHFSTDRLPAEGSGDFFSVRRTYFKRETAGDQVILKPLAEGALLKVGDQVEVQVSLRTKHAAEYVHLRDPRAAGLEPENLRSGYKYDLGIVRYEETRDSGANFFFEHLPVGEYTMKYRLRANMAGTFRVGPATVQSMYAPEFNAYSAGAVIGVKP